jgi:predicted secreted protein
MGVFEAIVVFVISWWLVFLPMLSAGTQSQLNAGDIAPGTEPAAPAKFGLGRKAFWTTLIAAGMTFVVWVLMITNVLSFMLPPLQAVG